MGYTVHDIRGVILDHEPPFFFCISSEALVDNVAELAADLLNLAQTVHHDNCKPCRRRKLNPEVKGSVWLPIGRIALDVRADRIFDRHHFDWDTVWSLPGETYLPNLYEQAGILLGEDERCSVHFVTTFQPDPPTPSTPAPIHSLSPIAGFPQVLRVVGLSPPQASDADPDVLPSVTGDFMTAITQKNSVLADNTHVFGAVNSGALLNTAAKWCYLFASPSAVSSQRFATSLQFFHDIAHSSTYDRISPSLGMRRVAPEGSASKHACLVFDFSDLFATPAHPETRDAVSRRLETFLWTQTARFVRNNNDVVTFRQPIDVGQYSGGDILQAVLGSIVQPAVFVSVRGLDAVFDRAFVASLWESAPHPSLPTIHDVLNSSLFDPLATAYEVSNGPLRKVLVTGRYPQLLLSGTRLGQKLVDLSCLPEVAPLHGISSSLLRDVLSATNAGDTNSEDQKRVKDAINSLCGSFVDCILRTPPGTAGFEKFVLDLCLARHMLETLLHNSSTERHLSAERLVESVKASISQSAYASFERISELIFPLLCKDIPSAETTIRHGRWRISGSMPDQFERSYVEFLTQPWRKQAVGVLYEFGYLIPRPLEAGYRDPETYEMAGRCAEQSIHRVFDDHVQKYATKLPPRRNLPPLVQELAKRIHAMYRNRDVKDLPTTEEVFQKDLIEQIRQLTHEHGHLRSCAITEVHVRYPPGTDPKICDGRVDIFLLERTSSESEPDNLYVFELKLRNLGAGTQIPTRVYMEKQHSDEWKQTRTSATGRNQAFRCDLRDVVISDDGSWFVDKDATDDTYSFGPSSWQYGRIRLPHIRCDYHIEDDEDPTSDHRSEPQSLQNIVDDAITQLKIYIEAICCGVEDEIGFLPGLTDARVTSLGPGLTRIVPIVVVNIGCTLLNIQELPRRTLPHRIGIVGSFPWTPDRAMEPIQKRSARLCSLF